jgi:hypothetical protein
MQRHSVCSGSGSEFSCHVDQWSQIQGARSVKLWPVAPDICVSCLSDERVSFHHSGAWDFEVAPTFLGKSCVRVLGAFKSGWRRFSVNTSCISSKRKDCHEWWIGEDVEESGRALFKVVPQSLQRGHSQCLRFEPLIFRMRSSTVASLLRFALRSGNRVFFFYFTLN